MAAEIEQELGLNSELVASKGGIFDVHADGQKLFSKHEQGDRFPNRGEVITLLKSHQDPTG